MNKPILSLILALVFCAFSICSAESGTALVSEYWTEGSPVAASLNE